MVAKLKEIFLMSNYWVAYFFDLIEILNCPRVTHGVKPQINEIVNISYLV